MHTTTSSANKKEILFPGALFCSNQPTAFLAALVRMLDPSVNYSSSYATVCVLLPLQQLSSDVS